MKHLSWRTRSLARWFRRTSEKILADQLDLFKGMDFEAMNAELNEPSEHDSDSGKDNASLDGEPSASIGKNESKSSGSKGKKKPQQAQCSGGYSFVTIPDDSIPPVCSACERQMVKVGETYNDSISRTEFSLLSGELVTYMPALTAEKVQGRPFIRTTSLRTPSPPRFFWQTTSTASSTCVFRFTDRK